jgi:hypothetical protein
MSVLESGNTMAPESSSEERSNIRTRITWGVFFFFFYIYRSMYSVLAEYVMKITSIGDTETFQNSRLAENALRYVSSDPYTAFFNLKSREGSTLITDWIGYRLNLMSGGDPIFINIGYQSIAFIGLIYFLLSFPPKIRLWMTVLLMLPSFSFWTSIASKESIIVSCTGILSGFLVRQYSGKGKASFLHAFAAILLYMFKPHYFIAILFVWCARNLGLYVKQKALLAYMGLLMSCVALYVFREKIDELSFFVQWSFETVAEVRSNRTESFFVERFDVFYNLPEGFFRAFMGPTIAEYAISPLHKAVLIESAVLLIALILILVRQIKDLPLYQFIVGTGVIFWTLFPNYPFGVMNAGSAVRYRSGWIILIFLGVAILSNREFFYHRTNKPIRLPRLKFW